MKYAVVYSSKTGNTEQLANRVKTLFEKEECLSFGLPNEQALQADVVFVGFWTDKGNCDASVASFLTQLTNQKVFLFGTAGFGADSAYFEKILNHVKQHLAESVAVVGTYMCQGKMPISVRQRYEAMENLPNRELLIENFDEALKHPNEKDLQAFERSVLTAIK